MKSLSPILLLLVFLFTDLGSTTAPSASPTAGSNVPRMSHPSKTFPHTSENFICDQHNPESPGITSSEPSKMLHAVSPEPSPHDLSETPKPNSLNTSISESLQALKINLSQITHIEPSETPKPTEIPHPQSSETPKPNSSKASHSEFLGTQNPDPTHTPHQESPGISKLKYTEISHEGTSDPDPTQALHPETPETHYPNTTETPNSIFLQNPQVDPANMPHPEPQVTHNPPEIHHSKFPTNYHQDTTKINMDSDPEISTSLHLEMPAPFKDQATVLNELPLNTEPETLATTQPISLKLLTSDFPPTVKPKASHDASPNGPDYPHPSSRIVDPASLSGPPNQPAPATLRASQRRSRGERVNTIIVVERVEETGVTLVGRRRGAAGGALCLFFAGTGLLIGVFLLLWCLYSRGTQHRPFAHHRLPNDGDEPVMHLDTAKEPCDLYFYAPDAWVPSHIATKQPLPTPHLQSKPPLPPRDGSPQHLEPLSPAMLPNNFL